MFRTGGYMWLLAPTRERGSQKGLLRQPRERGIGAHAPAWAPEGTGAGLQACIGAHAPAWAPEGIPEGTGA